MASTADVKKAQGIIDASGNSFHAKVLRALKGAGWKVRISPYYSDGLSGKPREVDLVAAKTFSDRVKDFSGMAFGEITVQLFIECKYIGNPTVFWMHEQDKQATFNLLNDSTPLKQNNAYTLKHHYLNHEPCRVAKLFASEKGKDTENEPIFKAINQSLNATIALRHTGIFPAAHGRRLLLTVSYPVIVCSDFEAFFAVDMESEEGPRNVSNNFLMEVNYAYLSQNKVSLSEYFLIDVVSFDGMAAFLGAIDVDVDAMAELLAPR